jgi:guanylate kinase
MARSGNLIIVSGPSGAGKSALVANVMQVMTNLQFSVSYTTRAPRGSERDGVEYSFVTHDEFQSLIRDNQLLEWAEVHGNYYGTSRKFVEDVLDEGEDVLLDIDVKGAEIIRKKRPDAIGIFILPPSFDVLQERLQRRALDTGVMIEQRLKRACREIRHYREYDYLIINEDLDISTQELESIILGARCRIHVRANEAKSILSTFGGMDAEDP